MRSLLQMTLSGFIGLFLGLLIAQPGHGATWLLLAAVIVLCAYWLLTDRWFTERFLWLQRLPGAFPQPRVKLDSPIIEEQMIHSHASGPMGIGGSFVAKFVKVPILNEHSAQVAAADVHARLEFEDPKDGVIRSGLQARWAHTEQAAERTPFAPLDDPELNEVEIPPGATRHVDIVASAHAFGGLREWTNRSMLFMADPQYQLGTSEVTATLTVRGSNIKTQTRIVRIVAMGDSLEAS